MDMNDKKYEYFFKETKETKDALEILMNDTLLVKMSDEEIEKLVNQISFADEVEENDIIEFKQNMIEYINQTKTAASTIDSMNQEWSGLAKKLDNVNDEEFRQQILNHSKINELIDSSIEKALSIGNYTMVNRYRYEKECIENSFTLSNMMENLSKQKILKLYSEKEFNTQLNKFISKMRDLNISFAYTPKILLHPEIVKEIPQIKDFVYDLCKMYNPKGKEVIHRDAVFLNNLIINIFRINAEKHVDVLDSLKKYFAIRNEKIKK